MSDPVTVAEAALLARDQPEAPWQQALVLIVSPPLSRAELEARIAERLSYVPRFRRVVAPWPTPTWVDDVEFNLAGHVTEDTLAAGQRLSDWVSAKLATPLASRHPLWEVTAVNGLPGGSQAIVARVSPALIDGYDNIHLFQELLDDQPDVDPPPPAQPWTPAPPPAPELGNFLAALSDPLAAAGRVAAGAVSVVARGRRSLTSQTRKQYVEAVELSWDAIAAVQHRHGCTAHDVGLTLATAGVRAWLAEHGRPVTDEVALVPLAVTEPQVLESAIGARVAPSFAQLPVSARSASEALAALATIGRARRDSGISVPARDLVDLPGFAPATILSVAAGTVGVGRPHTVMITNVPGPRELRYLGAAKVREAYAVTTTTDAEIVNISITSYHGKVCLAAAAVAELSSWAEAIRAELARLQTEAS